MTSRLPISANCGIYTAFAAGGVPASVWQGRRSVSEAVTGSGIQWEAKGILLRFPTFFSAGLNAGGHSKLGSTASQWKC